MLWSQALLQLHAEPWHAAFCLATLGRVQGLRQGAPFAPTQMRLRDEIDQIRYSEHRKLQGQPPQY